MGGHVPRSLIIARLPCTNGSVTLRVLRELISVCLQVWFPPNRRALPHPSPHPPPLRPASSVPSVPFRPLSRARAPSHPRTVGFSLPTSPHLVQAHAPCRFCTALLRPPLWSDPPQALPISLAVAAIREAGCMAGRTAGRHSYSGTTINNTDVLLGLDGGYTSRVGLSSWPHSVSVATGEQMYGGSARAGRGGDGHILGVRRSGGVGTYKRRRDVGTYRMPMEDHDGCVARTQASCCTISHVEWRREVAHP